MITCFLERCNSVNIIHVASLVQYLFTWLNMYNSATCQGFHEA